MNFLTTLLIKAPIESYAKVLAEDITKRYPPALEQQPGKRPSITRLTRIIEDTCAKAVDFQSRHRLGWLGRALFANAFRWALREKGYKQDFVDLATEALVVLISRKGVPAVDSSKKK